MAITAWVASACSRWLSSSLNAPTCGLSRFSTPSNLPLAPTSGVANSERFVGMVEERAGFVARVMVYPGEYEMESLSEYARRALSGEERILEYGQD